MAGWYGIRLAGWHAETVAVPAGGEAALAEGFCPVCLAALGGDVLNWCAGCGAYWNQMPPAG